ncbi:hypothetical protein B0H16DRAFT_1599190, partial [Mycena metata]
MACGARAGGEIRGQASGGFLWWIVWVVSGFFHLLFHPPAAFYPGLAFIPPTRLSFHHPHPLPFSSHPRVAFVCDFIRLHLRVSAV